ncbi:MAG: SufD family Fe-S cluster assembly protein [Gammaproteobacteria bacterium]|nr:SufD family Fe-S cluster assembly protein [Gammaproteobacteria bacterium]
MTATLAQIVVRAGEQCKKVVRVDTPSDKAQEHRLDIRVESGGALELQELHQAKASQGEGAIRIESNGSLEFQEQWQGGARGAGLLMRVRVALKAGAKLRHVAVVGSGGRGKLDFDRRVELAEGAEFDYTRVGAAGPARPEIEPWEGRGAGAAADEERLVVSMNGARARFRHHALMIVEPGRAASLDLKMDHRAGHAVSESLCRCILGANSQGRFAGRIAIAPEGQGADARMRNDNLLLDPSAHIETQPELEVYADQVQCAHGAATGALDKAALFYLRARGLSPQQARAMLVRAFASGITEAIEPAESRAMTAAMLSQALDGAQHRELAT